MKTKVAVKEVLSSIEDDLEDIVEEAVESPPLFSLSMWVGEHKVLHRLIIGVLIFIALALLFYSYKIMGGLL